MGEFRDGPQFLHMEAQSMRLWPTPPKYVDFKGLEALWMEFNCTKKH
jgi:hypothetical protein